MGSQHQTPQHAVQPKQPAAPTSASPERDSLLQEALPSDPLTPRLAQQLQRSIGNRATTRLIQRKSEGEPAGAFERRLDNTRGAGQPLPPQLQAELAPKFRADFSGVRIHTGAEAADLNRAVNARAFTRGQDIYMGQNAYKPETTAGKHLLAHELTHTLQPGAAQHVRGWWPTGDRLVTEMAISEGGFKQLYDQTVLNYLVDRSPDIDFIQDEASTMNRGIKESAGKIAEYEKLRKKTETQPQAIMMYVNNDIHYRRPAYMLSHGEAGMYKEEDASAQNAAVTKRLIAKAVSLWESYQHAESMSVLSDALHQAEDRGSHGEGNVFTGHDARLKFNKYDWEKQGVALFRGKTGMDDPDKWAPDDASVNQQGLVLGVGFAQGVLDSFAQQIRASEEHKIAFPKTALQSLPEKRKMSAKWFLPAMSSGATMVGAVGKTATGATKGEKRQNMALTFKQQLTQGNMAELYQTAKQIPTENIPPKFQNLLEEGMVFYEQGAGLLEGDRLYKKAYTDAKEKFEIWSRSRLRKGGLSKSERQQQAREYYLMEKLKYKGRQRAVVGEAIRKAYQDVFNGDIGVQKEDADTYLAIGLNAYVEYLRQNPELIPESERRLLGVD